MMFVIPEFAEKVDFFIITIIGYSGVPTIDMPSPVGFMVNWPWIYL